MALLLLPFDLIKSFISALFASGPSPFAPISCVADGTGRPSACEWRADWNPNSSWIKTNAGISIDLGVIEEYYPTLWNWITVFARGLLVLATVLMLDRKREAIIR